MRVSIVSPPSFTTIVPRRKQKIKNFCNEITKWY
nr:MAG TPA: hypothetical protein [Caudoviricetes sp.]